MAAGLACALPLLLVACVLILCPIRLPSRPAGRSGSGALPSLPKAQIAWGTLAYLATAFALGAAIAIAQKALFDEAARGSLLLFRHHVTDVFAYSVVIGLFLGIALAPAILYRLLAWQQGDRIVDLLDRPDWRPTPRTVRRELSLSRKLIWPVGIVATLLNLAAFDTFLEVGSREVRYSFFLSAVTHRHPTADVVELVVYSKRLAPSGAIVTRGNLEIRLRDGGSIDTYRLIETEHVPRVLAAFRRSEGFAGTVRAVDGYW
jgi:hypothetical protein